MARCSVKTWTWAFALLAAFALALPACTTDGDGRVLDPAVVAMTEATAPIFDDGETQLFQVSVPVELPLRRPTPDERRELGRQAPYPREPFLKARDVRVTVRLTVSNLDDAPHTVELLLDPWNEFVRYVPGTSIVGQDEVVPNFSGISRFVIVPPKERVQAIFTPDDLVEVAVDLGTAMAIAAAPPAADSQLGGAALFNRAFNGQNRSSEPDPLLAPYFPPVVAGVVGFDLGLRTEAAVNVALEAVIDVEDVHGDRMIERGDDEPRPFGRPGDALSPPAAAP